MLADRRHVSPGGVKHLANQKTEAAVPEHHTVVVRLNVDLFEDLEGGGEWFRKDRGLIPYAVRYAMKIFDRYRNSFSEGSVGVEDPGYASVWTVALESAQA